MSKHKGSRFKSFLVSERIKPQHFSLWPWRFQVCLEAAPPGAWCRKPDTWRSRSWAMSAQTAASENLNREKALKPFFFLGGRRLHLDFGWNLLCKMGGTETLWPWMVVTAPPSDDFSDLALGAAWSWQDAVRGDTSVHPIYTVIWYTATSSLGEVSKPLWYWLRKIFEEGPPVIAKKEVSERPE